MPDSRRGPGAGSTALITGASHGIGLELAHLFARDGWDLVIAARSRVRLKHLARSLQTAHGIHCYTLPLDLADAGSPLRLFRALKQEGITVDALVNNAGFGSFGEFASTPAETTLEMIQVNVTALAHLTRLFLPGMIERRKGWILNVASVAAFQPGPLMACYYASKAFVLSLSEAVAEETRGTGVLVTALCPGPTRTQFGVRAGMRPSRMFSGHMLRSMDARTVARAGYRAMLRGRVIAIPGLENRVLPLAVRVTPRALVRKAVRALQERRR